MQVHALLYIPSHHYPSSLDSPVIALHNLLRIMISTSSKSPCSGIQFTNSIAGGCGVSALY